MSSRSSSSSAAGAPRKVRLASGLVLSLLGACVIAAPAGATGASGPHYLLRIVEGSTTLPEYQHPDSVYVQVNGSNKEVVVEVIHAGLVVGQQSGNSDGHQASASVSPGPQVGDEVVLESPKGTPIARVTYDGLPTIDPTVCAGSTNFSGENTAGNVVEGNYEDYVLETPYHQSTQPERKAYGEAQVKTLSGTTFGGDFLKPLEIGEDVTAIESLKTPLTDEATYTYVSETERPVAACPAPPPPYTPPAPPVLGGGIVKLISSSIRTLLHAGARDVVDINQPGTVIQDLYLKNGTLPASASAVKHRKAPPALLLARGSATATAAGKVTVLLKATVKGRRRLKAHGSFKTVLITTLHASSGARITLGHRSITLHH
jgi:hypothetical protein